MQEAKLRVVLYIVILMAASICEAEERCLPLPLTHNLFTVGVQKYSGNKFYPEWQFDEESFLATYPRFVRGQVEMPAGLDLVWQNGAIVTQDKKVLFWRTCDKRFIQVDTSDGTCSYTIGGSINLRDRIPPR